MTDQMPQVNAEFGTTPVIEFPTPEAPKGLKVVDAETIFVIYDKTPAMTPAFVMC